MKCQLLSVNKTQVAKTQATESLRKFLLVVVCCSMTAFTISADLQNCNGQESKSTSDSVAATVDSKDHLNNETSKAIPNLPRAITSFGAAKIGDVVYIYGGNIDTPHEYYKGCQSGQLLKLDTTDLDAGWQVISEDDELQGVAMCSHGNFLYRIGGFNATNAKGEPQSLHSLDSFKRFDINNNQWEVLPALPAGRSSLDAFVVGDLLYVVGGWNMNGDDATVWHKDALVCDLGQKKLTWKTITEPGFERRAIALATHGKQLMVAGGMNSDEETTTEVAFYDPENETWSKGPNLPGEDMHGFGAAAATVNGQAVVSMMSGKTFILDKDAKEWHEVSMSDSPRFFHRLIPFGNRVMAIGGTSMETGKYDSNEWIETVQANETKSNK